ncbi:hypothetical protein Tco_0942990 [Tanacetum coccineum]
MADNRTMAQMLQAPIEGYEDAIVVPPNVQTTPLEIGLEDALVDMPKFKQMVKLRFPENLEVPESFLSTSLIPTRIGHSSLQSFDYSPNVLAEDDVDRVDGRPFLRTAKALIDLYEETLTLRVGKEELVYYADKSEKNKDKNFVHAISIIDFSKDDPFSGNTTNTLPPSPSPVKTSDNFEKFTDELAPLDSLPPAREYFFEENDKGHVKLRLLLHSPLTSPEVSELEAYLESDSIPPGINLTLPPTLEVSSSNPTSPTLTGEKVCSWKTPMFFSLVRFVWKIMNRIAIRKKIICLLATFLNKKPKPLSRPQEVEEIKEKEDKFSSDVPINTIVMPIRITDDIPI